MEESAFFMDLTVGGCSPVILTGAMRQANWAGADGPANLYNSIRLAASPEARNRGAFVLMNDEIFLAREVTKSNTTRTNAFSAPEAGPAGVTDPDGIFFRTPAPANCPAPLVNIDAVQNFARVDIVYSYIGADSTIIDAMVAAGARGIVVAGVGRGGTTGSQSRALRRATEKGVIVVTSNRTGGGRVGRPTNPESLRHLAAGVGATIGAGDLNPQKARILLSLALSAGMTPAQIATLISFVWLLHSSRLRLRRRPAFWLKVTRRQRPSAPPSSGSRPTTPGRSSSRSPSAKSRRRPSRRNAARPR
jgi:L-asparaginase